jgi:endonuclease/exonuclease/phosphatase family metal-dependent hydrolase
VAATSPLTASLAQRSSVGLANSSVPGVLPTSQLRSTHCEPCVIPTLDPLCAGPLRLAYDHIVPDSKLSDYDPGPIRLLSVNCGGLADKLPRLVALLLHTDADIVCLQEAATLNATALAGLPFLQWAGPKVRGGGLVVLLHHRRVTVHPRPPRIEIHEHAIVVTVAALGGGGHLSVANVHLPPHMNSVARRSLCSLVVSCLKSAPPGIRIICGDLNCSIDQAWLSSALAPGGIWEGYRCPYPPGLPTNFIDTPLRRSATELDWVLVAPDTPCTGATRTHLPGISTHCALQCDLHPASHTFGPADPAGRHFRFRQATADQLAAAGNIVDLLLWWAASVGLSIEGTIHLCRDGMRASLPVQRRQHVPRSSPASSATSWGDYDEPVTFSCRSWWQQRSGKALTTLLRIDQRKLAGVNFTSQTGRALRLSSSKVQPISRIRPDGRHFPSVPSEFRQEVGSRGSVDKLAIAQGL